MNEEQLRKELIASFKNRALLYLHFYREISAEVGEDKAAEIMRRAIYARGREVGQQFAPHGPANLEGLKQSFLDFLPDNGALFEPELERCDEEGLDIKFHRCPLKEAWMEVGLSDEEVSQLCAIAATVDNGTFEGAGFEFHADTWKPGGEGCCHLHIRPGKG